MSRIVKTTTPIAIQPGTRLLQLRWNDEDKTWILWLHHSMTFEDGTFLELSHDGSIERVTVSRDGSEQRHKVK